MFVACSESKFNRNAIGGYNHMDFETIEISVFRSTIAMIVFPFDKFRVNNAYI
jgi:hypothetical protein